MKGSRAIDHLSDRMRAIARLVPEGTRLLDVGTDHGWIPLSLLEEGRIQAALATDVREGPLSRAACHVREAGLEDRMQVRLSDGLRSVRPGEADGAILSGMGGGLILRILSDEGAIETAASFSFLILQPQKEAGRVRLVMTKRGWRIDAEDIVKEEGKFYPMMRLVPGETTLSPAEVLYGPLLLKERSPVFLAFLRGREKKLLTILNKDLPRAGLKNRDTRGRREAFQAELSICQEILYGQGKGKERKDR